MEQIGDVLTGLNNQQLLGNNQNSLKLGTSIGKYHPYRCPPDLVMATKHGMAKRVYVSKQEDNFAEEGRENCPCCGLPVEGDLIPLCAELSKLYHLGCGYALYFKFLKYCASLLVLLFIISGLYNMISDKVGSACTAVAGNEVDDNQFCLQDYVAAYTIANKRTSVDALTDQQILNLVAVVLIIVFFQFIRYELRKTALVADDSTITPSDYTIKLSGLHSDVKTKDIVEWIMQFSTDENPLVVRKICRSYDLVEFTELSRRRDQLADAKDKETSPEAIQVLESEIKAVHAEIESLKQKRLEYARVAYVTFERASMAAYMEERFSKSVVGHIASNFKDSPERLHGLKIKVKRAPEPSNILWENLGFSRKQKLKRKHNTTIMTAIGILIAFAIIFGLSFGQNKLVGNGENESNAIRVLSIVASVLISVINYVLGQIIRKLADYEKHGTYTGYFTGVARKLSVAQFINTGVTTLVAKVVIFDTLVLYGPYSSGHYFNFFGKGGLLEGIFYVFISNALLTPVMNIFDPFYAMKLWGRWRANANPDSKDMDQKEAHALFEGMPIDMSYKYALLIKTMYLTAFYASAIPVGMLWALLSIFLVYWSDKYILLRRAALPFSLADELSRSMVEYLEWAITLFGAGNIIFVYTLKDANGDLAFSHGAMVLAWIIFGIGVLHAILPMSSLNKKLFPLVDEVTENDTYDTARLEFYTDYDIENPITRERGLKEFRAAVAEGSKKHLRSGKTFNDEDVNLATLASKHSGHQHIHDDDEEETHGEATFGFLEGYIKTTHEKPGKLAQENKGGASLMEAQANGANYDRATSYKKKAGHAHQAAAYLNANAPGPNQV